MFVVFSNSSVSTFCDRHQTVSQAIAYAQGAVKKGRAKAAVTEESEYAEGEEETEELDQAEVCESLSLYLTLLHGVAVEGR